MKAARRRIDVNLEELDRVLDGARQAPLSEADHGKLKEALHALAAMLVRPRNTEKTSEVLEKPEDAGTGAGTQADDNTPPPGHGRNGAEAFGGAQKVDIKHQKLTHGERCPECGKGNVYGQKEPKVLVRIVGQAPLAATVYALENGPPANLIRTGFLARGLAGGKLPAAAACTLASPPTTSKPYLCKAGFLTLRLEKHRLFRESLTKRPIVTIPLTT